MEFDRFLENLPGDYKTILLSIALIFPMAYIDCWMISAGFAELELLKQVILAAGISVMLMMAGYFFNLAYLIFSGLLKFINDISLPVVATPTAVTTASLVIGLPRYPLNFIYCACGFMLLCVTFAFLSGRGRKLQKKLEDEHARHQENPAESSAKPRKDKSRDQANDGD